jgi:hypothetical protein
VQGKLSSGFPVRAAVFAAVTGAFGARQPAGRRRSHNRLEPPACNANCVPTQAELDALEAFQLFSGRQKNPNTAALTFGDAAATAGRDAALGSAQCAVCHRDLIGDSSRNFDINTGVADLQPPSAIQPKDGGFGVSNVDPVTVLPFANSAASVPMSQVVTWLGIAESDLITANPLNDF